MAIPRRHTWLGGLSWCVAALTAALTAEAVAQTPEITKAANLDNLTGTSAWVGGVLPTSTNTIVFDSTFAGGSVVTNTTSSYLTVYGIKLTNPGAGVTLSGAQANLTMGIGAGGIDMSSATRDLTFTSGGTGRQLNLTANQIWTIATGRTITIQTQGGLYVGTPGSPGTPRSLEVTGGGVLKLTAVNLTGGTLTLTSGTLYSDNGGAGGARSIDAPLVLNSGGVFLSDVARNAVTINSPITFNGGVFRATRPNPNSTYTVFDTPVRGGLTVGGSGGSLVFFGSFADYAQTPTLSVSGSVTGTGTLTVTNTTSISGTTPATPAIIFSGTNSSFAGTFDFQGASGSRLSRFSSATAGSGSATFNIASGNTVEVNAVSVSMGHLTGSGTLRNSTSGTTGNASVTVGALGQSGTFSGVIANGTSGNLAFTKTGTAAFALSGANTFTGLTTAGNGVLRFNSVTSGTGAQALGAGSVVNLGVAGTSAGEIDYVGGSGTLDKNVFALGTGRNRIRNSGGGTLTLSGTLTKNGTILELAGGTFIVSGQITGANANSDLFVNGATVTLTNSNNDYNGPTYVYGNGSLVLGASNVIPAASALTLGGTGADTGTGSITTGTFTDTIASLTTSSLGATVGISVNGATAGGLTMGGLTFGAGTDTLALSLTSPSLARYTLLTYTSRSGTFDSVTGSGNYNVVYGGSGTGTVDLQLKANQAATFTLTPAASRVLVGGSTTLSGALANTSPTDSASLAVNLSSGGSLTATDLASSSGATIAAGGTSTITATLLAGPTAGTQSWSVINTDSGAITTTSTASGTIDVVNQRSFSVSTGTIALGNFLRTAATSGSTTISSSGLNATTANAAIDAFVAQDTAGLNLSLASGTNVFNGGSAFQEATYALTGSATTAGVIAGSFTSDVTAELGTISPLTVSLTGTAYDPALASFTSGSATTSWLVDVGSYSVGSGTYNAAFSIFNLLSDPTFTADLTLLSIVPVGQESASLSIDLTPAGFGNLAAGGSSSWLAMLDSASVGSFTNIYQLNFVSSKDGSALGGPQSLTLTVTGVIGVPEPSSVALAGIGLAIAGGLLRRRRSE